VSIENDLFNTLKYAGFGKKIDPTKMIQALLKNLEVTMLCQMEAKIKARIVELQGEQEPASEEMDPFTILGVDMKATREEVDKAYRKKAYENHPDHGGDDADMAKINAAYTVIKQFKGWK
jgi:hypothetical protein